MSSLILRGCPSETKATCGLCGETCTAPAGNQFFVDESDEPVCARCGREHAPELTALLGFANAAERIGRMGRNSVFPPLTALLDLATAAERYTTAAHCT